MADLIQTMNKYLEETESFADEFLPLKDTLSPIQGDFQEALQILSSKAKEAEDPADKVFYLNRYADLVKKIEGIFDTRSKRIQQSISLLAKLPDAIKNPENPEAEGEDEESSEDSKITPEQAAEILKILSKTAEKKK